MPNPWVIVGFLIALIAAVFAGNQHGKGVQKTVDQLAVTTQANEAAKKLQAATERVLALQAELAQSANANEKETRDHEQALANANARADAAVAAAGGLHDPGRRGGSCVAAVDRAATQARDNASATAGARLSDEAAQFLRGEARRADEVTVRLLACEKDDDAIRAAVEKMGAAK